MLVFKVPLKCLGMFLPVFMTQVVAPKNHEDNSFGKIQIHGGFWGMMVSEFMC